ncbi:thioesterase II family protein [Sphaerisporangium dianthi]|uniref:Thioesterase II family protein n=1 Tax=Sphaerisporangium dianthi TaxID=1436120 RepID=A0ABV9CJ28_9ACTN
MTGTSIETGAWVRRFHPSPQAETRLICFPHAGGSASYYFPVSRALAPAVEVLAIQYPGRQDRRTERCVADVRELADLVVAELRAWTDRPMTLFGHSLGATLAFEVALRLEAEDVTPLGLFASGRRAPSCHREEYVHLSDDEGLIGTLKRMSGTDSQMLADEEMLRMILPAVRSDYKAAETYRYRPGPGLRCPITALTGDDDPEVTIDEARRWGEHTTGRFTLKIFPGGHFYLNEHAASVIQGISEHIAAR